MRQATEYRRASRTGRAKGAQTEPKLDVKQFQQTESNHPDANQIDRDHQIQQPRHYQNKNASDQRKDSWNMSGRDVHEFPQMRLTTYRIRTLHFNAAKGSATGRRPRGAPPNAQSG